MQDNFYGTQRSRLLIGLMWFPAHGFWQPPTWLHGKVCSPKMSSTKRDFDVSSTAKGGFCKLKLALSHDFSLDFDQQKPWLQTGKCWDVGMGPKVIRPVDPWFAYRSVSVHLWIFGAEVDCWTIVGLFLQVVPAPYPWQCYRVIMLDKTSGDEDRCERWPTKCMVHGM